MQTFRYDEWKLGTQEAIKERAMPVLTLARKGTLDPEKKMGGFNTQEVVDQTGQISE